MLSTLPKLINKTNKLQLQSNVKASGGDLDGSADQNLSLACFVTKPNTKQIIFP